MSDEPRTTELAFAGPLDLAGTLGPLRAGIGLDPTLRLEASGCLRASHTPAGPATLALVLVAPGRLRARAWGPGAEWALAHVRDLVGLDDPGAPELLATGPPQLRRLARRAAGVRLARTHRVVEALVTTVLGQLVTGAEAGRAFRRLVRRCSEPAPGPAPDLWLPPSPERLRALPAAAFAACGALPRQGAALRELAARARRLEEADGMPLEQAERRLRALPGIGPWTAGSVLLHALGQADAVPLGDYHLPRHVVWALTGELDGAADDARMLALLAPYRGQRGRVLRWIVAAHPPPPRRGPRPPLRALDGASVSGRNG